MSDILGRLLRKRHRYTWLVFGFFFLFPAYNWSGQNGVLNIQPPILLLVLYYVLGQGAATLIAYFAGQSVYDPHMALFTATVKGAVIFSIVSFLLHLGLLWLCCNYTWAWLPDFRSPTVVLIGSPVFSFMASFAASSTLRER